MKTSTEGLIALIGHEGIVLSRYKDSKGIWTLGVGHTKAAGGINPEAFTGTLTMAEAIGLLRTDIAKYEKAVNDAVKVSLTQYEFDALVSFHYNTGAIAKATLTKSLNAGKKQTAGREFMNWVKPPEIEDRRQAESTLFLTGKYPAPFANVYPADKNGKVLWGQGKRVDVKALLGQQSEAAPAQKPTPAPPVTETAPDPAKPSLISAIIKIILAIFGRKTA